MGCLGACLSGLLGVVGGLGVVSSCLRLVAEETPHHHRSEGNEGEYENIVEQVINAKDRHLYEPIKGGGWGSG